MCGIAGFIHPTAEHAAPRLQQMLDVIIHRGPNSSGVHIDNPLAMGMRRLSIIDLSSGDQPIANADGTIWTVSNGEIYNYRELREQLRGRGYVFKTDSDTEVIVHAYEEWGEQFVEHLEGMFGTALWDAKRRRLMLVRDRLGIKPLYFAELAQGLVFGSEMKSLFASGLVEPRIDEDTLQDYLALGYAIAPRTIAKGVQKLAPGELLQWEQGRISRRRYWTLPQHCHAGQSQAQWLESTRAQLEQAISSHLVSDVPLGSFLSGGVDSSGIVALMSQQITDPVSTYAIGYSGDEAAAYFNELPYAAEVAQGFNTKHREIEVKPDVVSLLPKLMWHLEEPISDTATMTTYLVSEFAQQDVTVIMSGVGGDELFAGYRRYLGDHYNGMYQRLPRWLRNSLISRAVQLLPSGRSNRLLDLGRYAKQFVQSADLSWHEQYLGYIRLADPTQLRDLRGLKSGAEYLLDGFANHVEQIHTNDPLLQLMALDLQTQLPEALLLLSDKMTMAVSLECRVPFLHHPLVEMAASMPAAMKAPKGELKSTLKAALADVLPRSVLERSKRGFGAPVGSWMQKELAPLRQQLLSKEVIERRGLFDWQAVTKTVEDHNANRQDYTDLLMVLMNVELWCRIFQDNSSPQAVAEELGEVAR